MFNGNVDPCEFSGHVPMFTFIGVKNFWSCFCDDAPRLGDGLTDDSISF